MYNQSAAADKNGRSELCQTTHATYPLWYPVGEKAREVLPLGHFFVISFLVVCAVTNLCLTSTSLGKLCSVPRFSATFREEACQIHSTDVGVQSLARHLSRRFRTNGIWARMSVRKMRFRDLPHMWKISAVK